MRNNTRSSATSLGRATPLAASGITLLLGACSGQAPEAVTVTQKNDALLSQNGLSLNGLSINGLSINGLSINGLSINGLSINGLSTDAFSTWFNQNADNSPALMSYLVKCALPAGSTLSWQNPSTGQGYSWAGSLGLAPTWAGGNPATVAEQQLITACLGAHANKYGLHIPIAVEGQDANGVQLAMVPGELTTYGVKEACFFGNLFTGQGMFVGLDHAPWNTTLSSARACAYDTSEPGASSDCPPMQNVGQCKTLCTLDPTGVYYTSCQYGGNTYAPLTTRIQGDVIYKCGDNTCQFTESPGHGTSASSCSADCGT